MPSDDILGLIQRYHRSKPELPKLQFPATSLHVPYVSSMSNCTGQCRSACIALVCHPVATVQFDQYDCTILPASSYTRKSNGQSARFDTGLLPSIKHKKMLQQVGWIPRFGGRPPPCFLTLFAPSRSSPAPHPRPLLLTARRHDPDITAPVIKDHCLSPGHPVCS